MSKKSEGKYCIVLREYGADEAQYIGKRVWSEDQAEDLLEIIKVLRGEFSCDHINNEEKDVYV